MKLTGRIFKLLPLLDAHVHRSHQFPVLSLPSRLPVFGAVLTHQTVRGRLLPLWNITDVSDCSIKSLDASFVSWRSCWEDGCFLFSILWFAAKSAVLQNVGWWQKKVRRSMSPNSSPHSDRLYFFPHSFFFWNSRGHCSYPERLHWSGRSLFFFSANFSFEGKGEPWRSRCDLVCRLPLFRTVSLFETVWNFFFLPLLKLSSVISQLCELWISFHCSSRTDVQRMVFVGVWHCPEITWSSSIFPITRAITSDISKSFILFFHSFPKFFIESSEAYKVKK